MTNEIFKISPSQVEAFVCQRKWAGYKIAKFPKFDKLSTATGTATHDVLERWLRDRTPPDPNKVEMIMGQMVSPGAIAMPGLKYLPRHEWVLRTEAEVTCRTDRGDSEGYVYHGKTDFTFRPHYGPGGFGSYTTGDHKTTGDFKWAKTPEVLMKDPQALIYNGAILQEHPEEKQVGGLWVYYKTSKPYAAKSVHVVMSRDHVKKHLDILDETGSIINRTYKSLKNETDKLGAMLSLPPNLDQCSAFGGCQYQDVCKISGREKFKAAFHQYVKSTNESVRENEMSSLLDRAKAASAGASSAPQAPSAAPPRVASVNPPRVASVNPPRVASAPPLPPRSAPPVPPRSAPSMSAPRPSAPPAPPQRKAPPMPVAPPAAYDTDPDPVEDAGEHTFSEEYETEQVNDTACCITAGDQRQDYLEDGETPPWEDPTANAPSVEVTPKKRGRKPGSTNAPKAEVPQGEHPARPVKTLYLNCAPVKGASVQALSDTIKPIADAVAEANSVPYYGMIEYAQGPAALMTAFSLWLEDQTLTAISVNTSIAEDRDVLPALMRWADVVIQGAR